MNQTKNINKLISNIIQKMSKQHITCTVVIKNQKELTFLNYLWYNKIIYGYSLSSNNKYTLYLKHRIINNTINFEQIKKMETFKTLLKNKFWSKNNFYIINTIKGFISINQIKILKIGGYVLHKIS